MKIAFDQHVPAGAARALMSLATEPRLRHEMGGFEIKFARDYAPDLTDVDYVPKSDAPWVKRFAADGGEAIISGDTKMQSRPLEVMALQETGLVVVFFWPRWNNWNFFRKSALILAHWKEISKTIKKSSKGQFWVLPAHWDEKTQLQNVTPQNQEILKFNPRQIHKKNVPNGERKISRKKYDDNVKNTKNRKSNNNSSQLDLTFK